MPKVQANGISKRIESPTLVITAAKDTLTPMFTAPSGAGAQWVADNIKDCELKVYDNIGHADLVEAPDETIATTIAFLRRAEKKVLG